MEVKSIFMNLILKTYEKQDASNASRQERVSNDRNKDTVSISPRAGKRLFRDIMENSLKKSLDEGLKNEN